MPLWPVAAREARAAARAPRTYAWRAAVTAIGIAIIPAALATAAAAMTPGHAVFGGVATLAFFYCILGGVLRTADTIAEEKRENTLGLLFLTDLKAGDVITGKLLASSATLFFGLLALLPLLAIPMLMGGVTSVQLLFMALCLINALFFAISCGFLVSTIFKQGWITISAALAVALFYCVLIPLLADNLGAFPRSFVRVISPTYMFASVASNNFGEDFWQSLAVTHLIAWLNILLTAKFLPLFWQDRPRSRRAQLWWDRLTKIRFGGSSVRKRFRTRLLNANPLYWLSGREQVSSGGLMTLLMFVAALSLVSGWKEVFVGLIVMHSMLLIRMSSAASHALAEDRKSGALELLLATSLRVDEVLKGRWMGLGRQFFGPILIVGIWHMFSILWIRVMGDKHESTTPLFLSLPALFFAWLTTGAYGMWMGLRARHPVAAIWGTLGVVLLLPWGVMVGLVGLLAAFQMMPDVRFQDRTSLLTPGIVIWGVYLVVLRAWTMRRVRSHFREAATDRYSDTQPIDWRPFWRVTSRIVAVAALVIAAVWGIRAWINVSGERELRSVLAAHPEFQMTAQPQLYVPREQNLAEWESLNAVNDALVLRLQTTAQNVVSSLKWMPLVNWRKGEVHDFVSSGNTPDIFRDLESDVARLHAAAAERPYYLPQRLTYPVISPNFVSPQTWTLFLSSRAEVRLTLKERPLDDILLALRFANATTNAPESLMHRSHANALTHVIQPVHDGIRLGAWTDSDLKTFQNAFSQIDTFAHYRAWQHHVVRIVTMAFTNPPTMANRNLYGNIVHFRWGVEERVPKLPGHRQSKQAELVRTGLERLAGIADVERRIVNLSPSVGHWAYENRDYSSLLASILNYKMREGAASVAVTEAMLRLVVTACAIERYRLAHAKLPDTLQQLTPTFLREVPLDVVNGKPIMYKPDAEGYLLYSIGLDLQDNGGRPELSEAERSQLTPMQRRNEKPGDWVWIYRK